MKYDLFIRVALAEDLPERHLRRGDVATVVEHHPGRAGQELGWNRCARTSSFSSARPGSAQLTDARFAESRVPRAKSEAHRRRRGRRKSHK